MKTEELLNTIVSAIEDKKGQNIVSLDLRGFDGAICDMFVVCHAASTVQVGAIAAGIEEKVEKEGSERVIRVEGLDNSLWVVMDYGDIMVHIFQTQMREFYGLEALWADAVIKRYS